MAQGDHVRLVVSNEHSRASPQMLLALNDKLHASRPAHGPLEGPRDCPLTQATIPNTTESDRCDDPIPGAEDQAGKGGKDTGVEPGGGDFGGEEGERQDGGGVDDCAGE